jgi:hypothetical protein
LVEGTEPLRKTGLHNTEIPGRPRSHDADRKQTDKKTKTEQDSFHGG